MRLRVRSISVILLKRDVLLQIELESHDVGEEIGEEVGVPAAWWHQHPTARIAAAAPRRWGARISKLLLAAPETQSASRGC